MAMYLTMAKSIFPQTLGAPHIRIILAWYQNQALLQAFFLAEPLNSRVVLAVAAYYYTTCVTGAAGLETPGRRAGPGCRYPADAKRAQPSRQTQQSEAAAAGAEPASPSDSRNVKRGAGSTQPRQSEELTLLHASSQQLSKHS